MPSKKRAGRRPTTASQSQDTQSQYSLFPPEVPLGESQESVSQFNAESIEGVSLPSDILVRLAVLPSEIPLNAKKEQKLRIAGEEAIADVCARDKGREGRLDVAWDDSRGVKRRRIGPTGAGVSGEESLPDVVPWYTAGLKFPCICQQAQWGCAYRPAQSPPRPTSLHPLLPHEVSSERPIPISQLPEWSHFDPNFKDCVFDLDPSIDDLKEFETAWKDADGGWGRGWAYQPRQEETVAVAGPSGVKRDIRGGLVNDEEATLERLARKGKGREISRPMLKSVGSFRQPLLPLRLEQISHPKPKIDLPAAPTPIVGDGEVVEEGGNDWSAESKRRKGIWRNLILADEGYEMMWKVIPRPHALQPILRRPKSRSKVKSAHDYNLPRALLTDPHPYHPSLSHYISCNRFARIYWLIPIHGPVYIPTINSFPPLPDSKAAPNTLAPSYGTLSTTQPLVDPSTRPFPLLWTPTLLHYLMKLLTALYEHPQQSYGALSVRLSGPKPDPFLASDGPPPLAHHVHRPESSVAPTAPVRPECGAHIRLYVDAKHALALRTWLNCVDIPWNQVGDHGTRHAHETKMQNGLGPTSSAVDGDTQQGTSKSKKGVGLRVFNRVRLTLVGERGEVLVVA